VVNIGRSNIILLLLKVKVPERKTRRCTNLRDANGNINATKISADNTGLATITRTCIEMFIPVVCPFCSFGGPESRELYFLIVSIRFRQIDTTSDVFPRLSRLQANN